MTRILYVLLALLPFVFMPSPTYALGSSFKADVTAVRIGCSKAGGQFQVIGYGGGAQGYGCVKANCDGKGGDCAVACDNNNNCVGSTPARIDVRTGIVSVLNNGWNRATASEGSEGSGGGRDTSGSGSTGASGGGDKDTAGGNNHAGDNHAGPSAGNNNDNGGGGGVIY